MYLKKLEMQGFKSFADKTVLEDIMKEHFRPEFINRIDEIILFNKLSREAIDKILDKIVGEIEARLKNIDLHIKLSESARSKLIEDGYDENFGARPLKRYIQKYKIILYSWSRYLYIFKHTLLPQFIDCRRQFIAGY